MRKILFFIFLSIIGTSCDSIQELKAPVIFVANIPDKAVLALASQYPSAKNIVSNEVLKNLIWEINFESNGKFIKQLSDQDGDILSEEEILGTNQSIPSEITEFLKNKYPEASLKSVSKTFAGENPLGFEATIFDKNESIKVNFNVSGASISEPFDQSKMQITKIISSNSELYIADNEINSKIKAWIKDVFSNKFDIKIINFQSNFQLIQVTEKSNPALTNQKWEYLFDDKLNLVRKYEQLNNKDLIYSPITDLGNVTINDDLLKKYEQNFGLKTLKFGFENSQFFMFSNNQGVKMQVKFDSKNSNPNYYFTQKILLAQLPIEISNYLIANKLTLISAKIKYKKSESANIVNALPEKYILEVELPEKSKKLIQFDMNNQLIY